MLDNNNGENFLFIIIFVFIICWFVGTCGSLSGIKTELYHLNNNLEIIFNKEINK